MLTDQMESLVDSLRASTQARTAALSALKTRAAATGSQNRRAHAEMAAALKSELSLGRRARAAQVDSMLQIARENRRRAGRDLRKRLKQTIGAVSASVKALRSGGWDARAHVAKKQKADFAANRKARIGNTQVRVAATRQLINRIGLSRQDMAHALSRDIAGFARGMRKDISALLGGFSKARGDMAGLLRGALKENAATLREKVVLLKKGFDDQQKALRDNAQAARQIWEKRHIPAASAAVPARDSGLWSMLSGAAQEFARSGEDKMPPRKSWAKMPDDEKILHVIRKAPDGISAGQIGEKVSLHASMVGKIAKELIDRGAVERDEGTRLYFPVKRSS